MGHSQQVIGSAITVFRGKTELHSYIERQPDCEILALQSFDISSMQNKDGACIHLTHYFLKGYILPIERVLL